jgi:hypothetical protein
MRLDVIAAEISLVESKIPKKAEDEVMKMYGGWSVNDVSSRRKLVELVDG